MKTPRANVQSSTDRARPLFMNLDSLKGAALRPRTQLAAAALSLSLGVTPLSASAQLIIPGDQLRVGYGPTAWHFDPSPDHADHNHLVSVELLTTRWTFWKADRSTLGLALFDNSFGQFSQYVFFGLEWDLAKAFGGTFYANVTGGLLHGYKPPYENKIPFNQYGTAPVLIPTAGWRYGHFSVTASLLGLNGIIFGASWAFDLK